MNGLPDLVVLGAMKAGTTSLVSWLETHPSYHRPPLKEPHFFSQQWDRGRGWYEQLYASAAPGQVSVDASVDYGDPASAPVVAQRMGEVLPASTPLLFIVRHPTDRMRSHYLHEVRRRRELAPFATAVARPGNAYVRRSLYDAAVEPYLHAAWPLTVLTFEEITESSVGWDRVLATLDLAERPWPATNVNPTATRRHLSSTGRWLGDRRILQQAKRLPAPIRRRLSSVAYAEPDPALVGSVDEPVPPDVLELLSASLVRLGGMVDVDGVAVARYQGSLA